VLAVDNLFAGYGRTRILHGITLSVPEHGLVALLGGNGTGKSTTLKCIAGLLRPLDGGVRLGGERIDGIPAEKLAARGLAMVPQGKEIFAGSRSRRTC
jgi:branched-chain amino acid transport system ATP-binding protein